MVSLYSCKKETPMGNMSVTMTDAPTNLKQVNVDVIGVEIETAANGWVTLPINAGVYDLLTLQNDVSAVLAPSTSIPAGRVNQLRLHLGVNNSVMDSSNITYPLIIPSGSETGLKINVDQTVVVNHTLTIQLDFDAGSSIVQTTNGYQLKPVLKIKSVTQH